MREELEEVREKIHERIRINHSIGRRRYFCRIFLNFGRQRQIFDCLPSIAKILVDTAESIAMSLLSFAKLFTNHRRDSSHGSIYLAVSIHRIDVSICRLRPDCRRPDIRGTLLPRTLYRSRLKIDIESICGVVSQKRQSHWSNNSLCEI